MAYREEDRKGFQCYLWPRSRVVDQEQKAPMIVSDEHKDDLVEEQAVHFLNLKALDLHAAYNIREQRHHIVITHGHIGYDLLQRNLFSSVVLVLLPAAVELET